MFYQETGIAHGMVYTGAAHVQDPAVVQELAAVGHPGNRER